MGRALNWKLLDNLRRKLFIRQELHRFTLEGIIHNRNIATSYRYLAFYKKTQINRSAFLVQQRNRCVVTGRVWNVLKVARYSRFVFRTEAYKGDMPGCRRASW